VTDANGQVRVDTVYVEELTDPDYAVQVLNDSLWVEGGVSYAWVFDGSVSVGGDSASHVAQQTGQYHAVVTDASGCQWNSDTVLVVLNVGMDEAGQQEPLLFPNPTRDVLRLSNLNIPVLRAVAMDVLGRSAEVKVTGSNTIDVGDLAPGTWMLVIGTGSGTTYSRFVKE
jgi:hypothetical protein